MKRKFIFILFIVLLLMFSLGAIAKDPKDFKDKKYKHIKDKKYKHIKPIFTKFNVDVFFLEDIDSDSDLGSLSGKIVDAQDYVSIDSNKYKEFKDKKAKITFKNKAFKNPIAIHNNRWDKSVVVTKTAYKTYEINVKGFSIWQLVENQWNGTHDGSSVDGDGNLVFDFDEIYEANFNDNVQNSSFVTDFSGYESTADTSTPSRSTNCIYGTECYTMDSDDDYIRIPTNPTLENEENFTSIVYVNLDDVIAYDGYISKAVTNAGAMDYGWVMGLDGTTNRFTAYISNTPDSAVFLSGPTESTGEHWFALTADSQEVNYYVDGEWANSTTEPIVDGGEDIVLGRFFEDQDLHYTNGVIECAKYYNKSLDEGELQFHNNWSTCGPDALAYYSFDDNNSDDISNNGNDGTVTGATYNSTGGILKGAYEFDGIDDKIETTLNFIPETAFTVSIWIKSNLDGTNTEQIINDYTSSGIRNWWLEINSGGTLLFYVANTTNAADFQSATAGTISNNEWHHVIIGYNVLGNLTTWLDGTIVTNVITDYSNFRTDHTPLKIGIRDGGNYNGSIDEIGIWDRVLTSKEITTLYASGIGINPYDGLISKWNMNEYQKNVTDSYGNNHGDAGVFHKWLVDEPILYVNFNSNNGTHPYNTVTNIVSYGNAGEFITAKSGIGMEFNGVDELLQLPGDNLTSFSFSFWTKPSTYINQVILGRGHLNTDIGFYIYSANNGLTWFQVRNKTGSFKKDFGVCITTPDIWYHLSGTYNAETEELVFKCNNQEMPYNGTGQVISSSNLDTYVFGARDGGWLYNGTIDEFKIWDRVLTEEELELNYNQTHTTNSFEFDGVDDEFETSTTSDFTDITIAVMTKSTDSGLGVLVGRGSANTENAFNLMYTGNSIKTIQWEVKNKAGLARRSFGTCDLSQWTSLIATYDNLTEVAKVYCNGISIGTQINTSYTGPTGSNEFYIGARGDLASSTFFAGQIAYLRTFDRVLNNLELSAIYENGTSTYYNTESSYITELYNATDYDPAIEANVWLNVTYSGDEVGDVESYTYYKVGDCDNMPPTWIEVTYSMLEDIINTQGDCVQLKLEFDGGQGYDSFSLANFTINSQKYLISTASNLTINPSPSYTDTTIIGNATYHLNDTDSGVLQFTWYVNDVEVYNESVAGLYDNDTAQVNLSSTYYVKDDIVHFNVTPKNYLVTGPDQESDSLTIQNSDFNITAWSPSNLTQIFEGTGSEFFSVTIADVDGDVVTSWIVNGVDTNHTGNTYEFVIGMNGDGPYTILANSTDGEFTHSVEWDVTVDLAKPGDSRTIAFVLILGILIGTLLYVMNSINSSFWGIQVKIIILGLVSGVCVILAKFGIVMFDATIYEATANLFYRTTLLIWKLAMAGYGVYLFVVVIMHFDQVMKLGQSALNKRWNK